MAVPMQPLEDDVHRRSALDRHPRRCMLLVEDNPLDVRLTRQALAESDLATQLQVASDGAEAMRYVRGEREHEGAPRPDVVLLDLHLPEKTGAEVLAEMKGDPLLSLIPVIVLTSSAAADDVANAYRRQANGYVTKPRDVDQFIAVVQAIERFWIEVVRLPES